MMHRRIQEPPPPFLPAYGYRVEYDGGMSSAHWFRSAAECDDARRRALWNLGYRLPRWWQFWRWGEGVVISDDDRAWFKARAVLKVERG